MKFAQAVETVQSIKANSRIESAKAFLSFMFMKFAQAVKIVQCIQAHRRIKIEKLL